MPDTVLPVRDTLPPPELLARHPHDTRAYLRLVDLYRRASFGAHPLDEREHRRLTEALGNAWSHLRPA